MALFDDSFVDGNKIIRTYNDRGEFVDWTVDQIISKKMNQWKGWSCAAGVSHIYVGYDGDVYRGNCRVGGKLGNIFEEFQIDGQWIQCTADFCGCGSDVMTPKVQREEKKDLLNNFNEKTSFGFSKRLEKIDQIVAVETAFRPPPHIRVQWDLGRRCNYSCSYCWPDVHSSSEPLKSHESLIQATTKLLSKLPVGKKVLFQFGGGEPTLYPQFLEFLQFIKSHGHSVVTTTNGSRHFKFFEELIELTSINISVHFEFAQLDKLKRNIEAILGVLKNQSVQESLEIKLMTPPGVVRKSKAFLDDIRTIPDFDRKVAWSYVPIRHGLIDKKLAAKVVEYDETELQIIQERL